MPCRRFNYKLYLNYYRYLCSSNLSTKHVPVVELNELVRSDIESEKIKPRKHPGVIKLGTLSLPDKFIKAAQIISEDYSVATTINDAKILRNQLFCRHYPLEEEELSEKRANFSENVRSRLKELPEDASEEQIDHYRNQVKSGVSALLHKYSYHWSPMNWNDSSCMVYLFARAAANYAAVMRVFLEIDRVCPDYKPTSIFDFGSGIGSVSWAAKHFWGDSLKEYMNVDNSSSMNELAARLLCDGSAEAIPPMGTFYRMFLPAQHPQHSLVVSAHSLMELESRNARLNTLFNLWNKTKDFLVIIEQGTKPGFKLVLEARDFILSLTNEESPAHILAPCPHEGPCPRFSRGPYPCNFDVKYFDLPIGKKEEIRRDLLSFVIIRRGKRETSSEWPRVVRPVLRRHNHVICRLCTEHGDLREIIFTKKKHSRVLYKCAKVTKWGDCLPVKLEAISPNDPAQEDQPQPSDEERSPD